MFSLASCLPESTLLVPSFDGGVEDAPRANDAGGAAGDGGAPAAIDDPCAVGLCTGQCTEDKCVAHREAQLSPASSIGPKAPVFLAISGSYTFVASDLRNPNMLFRFESPDPFMLEASEYSGRTVGIEGDDNGVLLLSEDASAVGFTSTHPTGLWRLPSVFGDLTPGQPSGNTRIAAAPWPGGFTLTPRGVFMTSRDAPENQWALVHVDEETKVVTLIHGTTSTDPLGAVKSCGTWVVYASPWRGDILSYDMTSPVSPAVRVVIDGPAVNPDVSGYNTDRPWRGAFVCTSTQVYGWTGNTLYRAPLDGFGAQERIIEIEDIVDDVTSDGAWVYWTERSAEQIRAYKISDGSIRTFAQNVHAPGRLLIHESALYWLDRDNYAVYRMPLL